MSALPLHGGWYLVAFADAAMSDITPVRLGEGHFMLVRTQDLGLRLFDATCPHRGADLAHGGQLRGRHIMCPFHGRRIGLDSGGPWQVRSYPTHTVGGLVLVTLGTGSEGAPAPDRCPEALSRLLDGLTLLPAVDALVSVPVNYVVENAFDTEHFSVVHGVPRVEGDQTAHDADGFLVTTSRFVTVQDPWGDERTRDYLRVVLGQRAAQAAHTVSSFRATAYSPTLVATCFDSPHDSSVIITGAVPTPGGTHVRVAVAGSPGPALERAAAGARKAIEQDTPVWEHLDTQAPSRLDDLDDAVRAFQAFCRGFPAAAPPVGPWDLVSTSA
jgi:nitrite reductase/ring-hydroxylating ferredoxin subunit